MDKYACAMCLTVTITIKTVCFNMTRIYVCLNGSFRDFKVCLFDFILYVPSTIIQLYRDGSSWVEPVLS